MSLIACSSRVERGLMLVTVADPPSAREDPAVMVMMSCPKPLKLAATFSSNPCPMEIMETTAATPMTMPRTVSQLRSLL